MKKLHLSLIAMLMFWQASAFALGLGNVQLHSRLGDILHAEIPLTGLGQFTLDEIKVEIGHPDTYRNLGIEYLAQHQQLRFRLESGSNDEAILHITSTHIIKEPFLHFAIQVRSPTSLATREISLLLDLPR